MLPDMDHLALLASIPPETRADFTRRTNANGLIRLGVYLLLIAVVSAGIVARIPLWPLLMLPQGILLTFLFTLSHECTHRTPFRAPWLNEFVGHAIAPLIALPFIWFRHFHMAHHRHTNDPDNDPELRGGGRPVSRAAWLLYVSGLGYWRAMIRTLATNAIWRIGAPYLPARRHRAMKREARIIFALYLLFSTTFFLSPLLVYLWLVPVLIGQPFLRLYLLAEHGRCPVVADMLENSRTTFTTATMRFLAWNMPYHAEHHAMPTVPFHRLPDLHRWCAPHLKSTSPGYVRFNRDYVRDLAR
jgi:fatty acid desaturase